MATSSAEHAHGTTQDVAAPIVNAASQSYYETSEELYRILCLGEYFVFASEAMGHSRGSTTAITSCKFNTMRVRPYCDDFLLLIYHAGWKSICNRMTAAGWVRKSVEFGGDKSWICVFQGINLVPTTALGQTKSLTSK
jgi:hypothetical protein